MMQSNAIRVYFCGCLTRIFPKKLILPAFFSDHLALSDHFGKTKQKILQKCKQIKNHLKGASSYLRKFLATESYLKMMKNAFYFTLKALFALMIFKFLS